MPDQKFIRALLKKKKNFQPVESDCMFTAELHDKVIYVGL